MKKFLSLFIRELVDVFKFINNPKDNIEPKELESSRKDKNLNSLAKCYKCHGAGTVNNTVMFGEKISRYGGWDGVSSNLFSTCPVCKGTGLLDSSKSINNDKEAI